MSDSTELLMRLRVEAMADEQGTQAILYRPVVLAGHWEWKDPTKARSSHPMHRAWDLDSNAAIAPTLHCAFPPDGDSLLSCRP